MSLVHWTDTCSLCNQSRFWPSRSGYKVCYVCNPNPLQALIILARRGSVGAIRRAQGWVDEHASYSTNLMETYCSNERDEQEY
jgi:hypothetical protein